MHSLYALDLLIEIGYFISHALSVYLFVLFLCFIYINVMHMNCTCDLSDIFFTFIYFVQVLHLLVVGPKTPYKSFCLETQVRVA